MDDDEFARAIALEDQGRFAEAQELYLALSARGVHDAVFNLAWLQLRTGYVSAAAENVGQYLRRFPDDSEALRVLAHCRAEQGRTAEAIGLFALARSESELLFYGLHA